MNILSVSRNHDASVAVVVDGELKLHAQEERHSRLKKDDVPFWALNNVSNIVETIEDAINTLKNSKLEYLYLPELETLIKVSNKIKD